MARTNGKRQARDQFYIITNGENTEYYYFTLLKAKRSIYDVKIQFVNADPLGLVEHAERYVGKSNQVWIVFDVDYTHRDGRLVPAINQADELGIKYAFSNLAFEVWLISHFQKCSTELDTNGHKRILDRYLNEKKVGLKYSKTDEDILKKYFIPNYGEAVQNAKAVHQQRLKIHREKYGEHSRPKIWEWNSCTTVYKLVEALKLEK